MDLISIFEQCLEFVPRGINQRGEPRVSVERSYILSEEDETALLVDISRNGMAFQGDPCFHEEEQLILHIMLSKGEIVEDLPCIVRWAKKANHDEVKYGVRFGYLSSGQILQINNIIYEQLQKLKYIAVPVSVF